MPLHALGTLVAEGRVRELVISRVDGRPVGESPLREAMRDAGFVPGYRGLVLRSERRGGAGGGGRGPGDAGRTGTGWGGGSSAGGRRVAEPVGGRGRGA